MPEHGPSTLLRAAEAARRHFIDEQSNIEIAAAMGISRFKVARLLEEAREAGLVRIEILSPAGIDAELSARLRSDYDLHGCIVVSEPDDTPGIRELLGDAAARLLTEQLQPGDVLGLPWARTVSAMVDALAELPRVGVVQLTGSLRVEGGDNPVDLVRSAARKSGGAAHLYFAPFILEDDRAARAIRRHPDIAAALEMVPSVTVAVVGVGAWEAGQSSIYDALDDATRDEIGAAGVVGEALGVLVDADGSIVRDPLSERMITLSGEQLAGIPEVIAVTSGRPKARVVAALARRGLVTSLVVDASLARALVDLAAP